jgi:hypothetical protein
MPTILTIGPYRFFFVSQDSAEPLHIHIQRERMVAKFWLDPLVLDKSGGFQSHELTTIGKLVEKHRDLFMERWNEHFSR